jgi:ketosteroid isomerase-like protein
VYAANDRDGIASALAEEIEWTIPGHHPLSRTKRGIDEVLAFFAALDSVGQGRDLLPAGGRRLRRRPPPRLLHGGDGKVDTTWAFVWHLDAAGKVDRVVNLSGDQHQMDAFIWANFPLMPLPERLVG